jgi:hypothetical protein
MRMPISARLRQFRRQSRSVLPPSKIHAKEISGATREFFRKVMGPGNAPAPGERLAAINSPQDYFEGMQLAPLYKYYVETLLPLECSMAQKGVFLQFDHIDKDVYYGDIFEESSILGFPLVFVANVHGMGAEDASPRPLGRLSIGALYADPSPHGQKKIFVFPEVPGKLAPIYLEGAKHFPSRLASFVGAMDEAEAAWVLERVHRRVLADGGNSFFTFRYLLCQLGTLEDKSGFLDKLIFDNTLHEVGHMILDMLIVKERPPNALHELFAESFMQSVSAAPRVSFMEFLSHAQPLWQGSTDCHDIALGTFLEHFNGILGIEGVDWDKPIGAFTRYMCMSHETIHETSRGILEEIASSLGLADMKNLREEALKQAKRAIFG